MLRAVLPPLVQLKWCESGPLDGPWFPPEGEPLPSVAVGADAPVEYVDPAALAMLGAWAVRYRSRGGRLVIDDTVKGPYAWRCGLLSALAGRFGETRLPAERQLLCRLRDEADIPRLAGGLRSILHLDKESAPAPAYFLSELLRNVFEHSGSPEGGFVAAGYFPNSDRVTIAVADLGMTVPAHVRRRWPGEVDARTALALALEPRVSGSADRARNAGLGLYMTRRVTALMEGRFWLVTGGLVAQCGPARAGETEILPASATWPGTCVCVTLHPDRIRSFARDLLAVQRELAGGPGAQRDIFRSKPPSGCRLIRVPPGAGGLLEDKLRAAAIREGEILPALAAGESLALDFSGVALTTQSCMHALIAEPLRHLGAAGPEGRLWFVAAKAQVRDVIRIVMGYAPEPE